MKISKVGQWSYSVAYDTNGCETCQNPATIQLQITTSPKDSTDVTRLYPWVSLTAGSDAVNASKHQMVISAKFQSKNGPLGDLSVSAEIIKDSTKLATISLTDSGTLGKLLK